MEQKYYHEDFRRELGIDVHDHWRNRKKVPCPECGPTRKKSSDPALSIHLGTGHYKCHHCGIKGKVGKVESKWARPKVEINDLHPAVEKWLRDRELSQAAWELCGVGGAEKNGRVQVIFNYYDVTGPLVNAKARDIYDKKWMRQVPGAKPIPYNARILKHTDYVIITEGEPDVIAWHTANLCAISGPNGSEHTDWIETVYDELEAIEKIYIAVDNDEKGEKYKKLLASRLDRNKLYTIDYAVYNDANDALIENGQEAGVEVLKDMFDKAEPWPIEGILRIEDNKPNIKQIWKHGWPDTWKTGIPELDKHWTLYQEDVTLITGTPNAGKSNFVDWLQTVHIVRNKLKFGVYSGEKSLTLHTLNLAYKTMQRSRDNMDPVKDEAEFDMTIDLLNDHIFHLDPEENTISAVLEKGTYLRRKHGVSAIVLDNWTTLDLELPSKTSLNDHTGKQLGKIQRWSRDNFCSIWIVAHPRKLEEMAGGIYKMPGGYDIMGSSHFFNLTDNILSLRAMDGYTDFKISKIRNQEFVGQLGVFQLDFHRDQGGIYGQPDTFSMPDQPMSPHEIKDDDLPW